MLLDDLLKARVVELSELRQVMNIRDDIAQILFKKSELIFRWLVHGLSANIITTLPRLLQMADNFTNFLFTSLDSSYNLSRLHALECENLVQLSLELADERLFIIFCPWSSFRTWVLWGRFSFWWCLKGVFEIVVGDVIIVEIFDQRATELLTDCNDVGLSVHIQSDNGILRLQN